LGLRLPENFDSPYFKPNLTQFWNSWHMTLTQWFRSYFFNPITRSLRSADRPLARSNVGFLSLGSMAWRRFVHSKPLECVDAGPFTGMVKNRRRRSFPEILGDLLNLPLRESGLVVFCPN